MPPDERPIHLARFSLFVLLFSLFFWAWALLNTLSTSEFDYGLVCFLFSSLTSSYMLAVSNVGQMPKGLVSKFLTTASHIFVALVYLLVIFLHFMVDHIIGLGIYCIVFTLLWSGIAYCGYLLMNKDEPPRVGEAARLQERMIGEGKMTPV